MPEGNRREAIIPLGGLPGNFSAAEAAQRAGPALFPYLALLRAGFALPQASLLARWALTSPFHPCLRASRGKAKKITHIAQKNRKQVNIPIHRELLFALEVERVRRSPAPSEPILLNPSTGKPMSRPRLYYRMNALGKRAGVEKANPHRFRDTFAADLLLKGTTPYYVARLLGDTIQTIEDHYSEFVQEHQERARQFIEADGGLESLGTLSAHPHPKGRSVN